MQRIHGFVISADVALPGLPTVEAAAPDVRLGLVDSLPAPQASAQVLYHVESADPADASVQVVRDADGRVCFRYGDGTAFDLDLQGGRILAVVAKTQTLDDLAAYLYGPVLGYLLRARGVLALHASCVEVDGEAVLFAGSQGQGKSTTAAALAESGYSVLSDDLTAIGPCGGRFCAHAAFDHVRLWPASEPILFGREGVLHPITPTWEKRRYPLREGIFQRDTRPVSTIYLLDREGGAVQPSIRTLAAREALLALTALTYANYLLDAPMRALELDQLGELVGSVPVHRLVLPESVTPLRTFVLEHLRRAAAAIAR